MDSLRETRSTEFSVHERCCSSSMGAIAWSRHSGDCDYSFEVFLTELVDMGAPGLPSFACPWCGKKEMRGTLIEGINRTEFSVLECRCSSPMGAPAWSQHGDNHEHSSDVFITESVDMGSSGPEFVCPWCGRTGVSGYAIDGVHYPICSRPIDFSCMDLVTKGITKNGVRAGALYRILTLKPVFQEISGACPSFFLNLCDLMYGRREEGLDFGRTVASRMRAWNAQYVHRTTRGDMGVFVSRFLEQAATARRIRTLSGRDPDRLR